MNDLDKYIKRQKLIGIIIAISSVIAFIITLIVFLTVKINNNYIWTLIIPLAITLGFIILGVGWYIMMNKSSKER